MTMRIIYDDIVYIVEQSTQTIYRETCVDDITVRETDDGYAALLNSKLVAVSNVRLVFTKSYVINGVVCTPFVRPLKLVSLTQTCGACPSQWNAMTDDGRQVYIRYRWGYLSVCVGEAGDTTEYAGVRGDPFIGEQHGDEMDGVMSTEELMEVCGSRIEWPTEVAAMFD